MSWTTRAPRRTAALLLLAGTLCWPAGAGAAGEHDHDHGGAPVQAPDADRCDLGFNTKSYNDLARARQTGLMTPTFAETFLRHVTPGRLLNFNLKQSRQYWLNFNVSKHMYDGMVKQPNPHLHPLTQPWNSLTDPVVCDKLKQQLRGTRTYAEKFPSLADSVKGGYTFITPFFAGAGTHMGRWEHLDDKVEIDNPEILIYDGNTERAKLVGVMYAVLSPTQPKNVFAGGNDQWHQHRGLCFTRSRRAARVFSPMERIVIGSERADPIWCKTIWGGEKDDFASLWMMHVWVVPGCENNWGLFAHDHPYLTVANSVDSPYRPWYRGCGHDVATTGASRMETDELNLPGRLSTYRSSQLAWSEGGAVVASGPVAAELADHPGEVHAGGEEHLAGKLVPAPGFSGPTGDWAMSILRKDNVIRGTVTTPGGVKATFTEAIASRTECGIKLTAAATKDGGGTVELELELCDPGLRSRLVDPQAATVESLQIDHPAHGHPHAKGLVRYTFDAHPGGAHSADEEHLLGTATTLDGFEGDAGAWTISFLKNTATKAITGYLKNPAGTKTFNFVVDHHEDAACADGVMIHTTGSEAATPTDPQNPTLTVCNPDVAALFADHPHDDGHVH